MYISSLESKIPIFNICGNLPKQHFDFVNLILVQYLLTLFYSLESVLLKKHVKLFTFTVLEV